MTWFTTVATTTTQSESSYYLNREYHSFQNGVPTSQPVSDVVIPTPVSVAPIVKTVVKTITVDNPELQKKIDELSQKLDDESGQLIKVTNQYNDLLIEYNKTVEGDKVAFSLAQNILTDIVSKCKSQPPVYIPQSYISPVQRFPSFSCTSDNVGGSTYTYCR